MPARRRLAGPGVALLCLAAPGLAGPAAAQDCRLALVLALDVSSSVDAREDRLQREGLAKALTAPAVLRAFAAGDPVAVAAFEWSGEGARRAVLPWTMVADEGDAARAAEAVLKSRRGDDGLPTAVGDALGHALGLLAQAPACRARTVDVSGDGIGNQGPPPRAVYADPAWEGVTVNALVIGGATDAGGTAALVAWFQAEVLRGPGAFSIYAEGYGDYARAMEMKLLRELEAPAVSGVVGGRTAG